VNRLAFGLRKPLSAILALPLDDSHLPVDSLGCFLISLQTVLCCSLKSGKFFFAHWKYCLGRSKKSFPLCLPISKVPLFVKYCIVFSLYRCLFQGMRSFINK
jgi:hypothetical protein